MMLLPCLVYVLCYTSVRSKTWSVSIIPPLQKNIIIITLSFWYKHCQRRMNSALTRFSVHNSPINIFLCSFYNALRCYKLTRKPWLVVKSSSYQRIIIGRIIIFFYCLSLLLTCRWGSASPDLNPLKWPLYACFGKVGESLSTHRAGLRFAPWTSEVCTGIPPCCLSLITSIQI